MEAIRKESLLAASLLSSCACLASNDIPNFLLEEFAKNQENNPNSEILEEALGTLNCYSMLAINEQKHSSSIHRLVQEVIRLKWGKEKTNNLMNNFNLLIGCFPYYGNLLADYAKKRQLIPHLEAFLTHLETWQQEEQQLRKAREKDYLLPLLNYMIDGYFSLGHFKEERKLLERALTIEENHYGLNHPEVAVTLNNLGDAYGKLGDSQKKRELLERALTINEKHYGPDHPEVAVTLKNLGYAYGSLGYSQKERELLEQALTINEKHYGPDHPNVAVTLNNLGDA
jgi:tetratricopeptide (TPR) repeat protein